MPEPAVLRYVAHAFGQDFSLPLPLWLFQYAGIVAVLLSFVALGLLGSDKVFVEAKSGKRYGIPLPVRRCAQLLSLGLLALAITSGLFGPQAAADNFAVSSFWVLLLVGMTYVSMVFGNIWSLLNPFRLAALVAERLAGRRSESWSLAYPARLGYWPAWLIFCVITSLELLFGAFATKPSVVACILLVYVLISVVGSLAFGSTSWFRYGDFLSVYFRLVSKVSPLTYWRGSVSWRWPLAGLLRKPEAVPGLVQFVVIMLAAVSFDGFTETGQYAWLQTALAGVLPTANAPALAGVLLLLLTFVSLLGLYVFSLWLVRKMANINLPLRKICAVFVPSLVPVAIGYHVAHYAVYFWQNGQTALGQLLDMFGLGWNTAGVAAQPIVSVPGPQVVWYIQVSAIVAGHVAGVYVAHRLASRLSATGRSLMLGQLPLVGLMVAYTMASLWIIAQPAYISRAESNAADKRERQFQEKLRPPAAPQPPVSQ